MALLDPGCTHSSIDEEFVDKHKITKNILEYPRITLNADGTENKHGRVNHTVDLLMDVDGHKERITLAVTKLSGHHIFLGFDWVEQHNPEIDWNKKKLKFTRCQHSTTLRAMPNVSTTIAIEQEGTKEKKPWTETVPREFHDFKTVFTKESFDTLPEKRKWDHAIDLKPDFTPTDCPIYPLTPGEREKLNEFIDENESSGRIRPSNSPMASPFFFISKKDGNLRPVQDYRKLNEMTIKNRYPIPLTLDLLDKLKNNRYFTKLDIRWGYNNVRIKEGDEWKAAFKTHRGLHEPTVMFFGLTNSPATFQTMMDEILHPLIKTGKVMVYLDDILIMTETLGEHIKLTRQVLTILHHHKLYLKPEKCDWIQEQVEYLGHIVSYQKIQMDPAKVNAITDWRAPSNKKQLQSFLGFANYYRRFIKDYSTIARPLTNLTGHKEWNWNEETQRAFDQLKAQFVQQPILHMPQDDGKWRVEVDASQEAMGAILSQHQKNEWVTIAYWSKAFTPAERNYDTYNREVTALISALQHWRQYLLGTREPFEAWTDHQNLLYWRAPQKLNRRQARWALDLADYNFTLHHLPGVQNSRADALSRLPQYEGLGAKDNEGVTLLPPVIFRRTSMTIQEEIRQAYADGFTVDVKRNPTISEDADKVLYWHHRIIVPDKKELRAFVISQHHDVAPVGHTGVHKTHELITRNYWWPTVLQDVKAYVRGCATCQRIKPRHTALRTPLHPNTVPDQNWEVISTDLIGPLPESNGYNSINVIVDRKSKMAHFIPTTVELSSFGQAKLFRDHVFAKHGLPRTIISDRGPQYVSQFMKEFYRLTNIRSNASTAFHPQTDGQTERVNREVEVFLRAYVNEAQDDWDQWLSIAEFAYNNRIHSSTGFSPFFLNYGFHPAFSIDGRRSSNNETADQFAKRMKELQEQASTQLTKTAEYMKTQYDKKTRDSPEFRPGDKVWLESTNIRTKRTTKKLDDKRFGPFPIVEKVGQAAYKLELPHTWRQHPVFHESLLTPFIESSFPNQDIPRPPPEIDEEGHPEYEVETILESRKRGRGMQYLVKWKGYPYSENTWEPAASLKNAQDALSTFLLSGRKPLREDNVRIRRVRFLL